MTLRPGFLLYPLLFVFSTVLLGLTAYRVHYTKSLSGGDILTTRSHYYDPRIVALLVGSILAVVFSMIMLVVMLAWRNGGTSFAETGSVLILWIYFLITAALVTDQFSNLKWCRGGFKECSVLETIKAFSWMCWAILSFLLLAVLVGLVIGRRETRGAAATTQTRQVVNQPTAGAPGQPTTQGAPTAQGPKNETVQSPRALV